MTAEAFAPYAQLGYTPSDFILSRAQADAKGYKCNGKQFVGANKGNAAGSLPGYINIRPNPYLYLYNQRS